MKHLRKLGYLFILTACWLLVIPSSQAYFFMGARAQGMGGAYTAIVDDAGAVFWNPAVLGVLAGTWSVTIDSGKDYLLANDASSMLEYLSENDPSGSFNYDELSRNLNKLSKLDWIAEGGGRFALSIAGRGFGFSVSGYDLFTVQPIVDTTNTQADPDSEYYIGNNQTQLAFSGFGIREYGLSYAWLNQSRSFSIGVTAKYMDITAYHLFESLWQQDSFEAQDLVDHVADGDSMEDSGWNFDAGLFFGSPNNRLGISGKNLKSMTVSFDETAKYRIKPLYRLGYAFIPSDQFTFAVDYNLTASRDPSGNKLEGRDIAIGFEAKLGEKKTFILRGGGAFDKGGDSPVLFSGGAGLNLKNTSLDVSYSMDDNGDSRRLWMGIRIHF